MALPAPPFPPPDTDRAVDELRTDVSIYKKTQKLDARVASMLRTKAACLASDLHREEESHAEDLKMVGLNFVMAANALEQAPAACWPSTPQPLDRPIDLLLFLFAAAW